MRQANVGQVFWMVSSGLMERNGPGAAKPRQATVLAQSPHATRILPATARTFRGDAIHTATADTTLTPAPTQNASV